MVTVLTASSSSLFGDTSLNSLLAPQTQALTRVTNEITAKQEDANARLEERQNVLSAESDRLVNVKSSALNAQYAFQNASEAMASVKQSLLDIGSAIAGSSQDLTYYRDQFNSQWGEINSSVDGYSPEYNPIGNVDRDSWTPNTVEYKQDTSANMVRIGGTYAGNDFKITLSDGSVWRPDSGTSMMQRYNADGTKDAAGLAVASAVELSSYDASTGQISLKVTIDASAGSQTVSGTLDKAGLGLMPSWFYRSQSSIDAGLPALSTDADRAMAYSDLNVASAMADVADATVQAGLARVNGSITKIDGQISENVAAQKDAMVDNMNELVDIQNNLQRQYQIMAMNLSRATSTQQQYANVFASTAAKNPFFDELT